MSKIIAIVGALAAVIGLTVGLDIFGLWYRAETAPIRGKSNAEVQIESAPSRIQRYEEFFALCQSVQTKEDQILALQANQTMKPAKRDIAITAQQAARSQLINEYNSKSAQAYTAARFKDSNLPSELSRLPFDGTNLTNCKG